MSFFGELVGNVKEGVEIFGDTISALTVHPLDFIVNPTKAVAETRSATPLSNSLTAVKNAVVVGSAVVGANALVSGLASGSVQSALVSGASALGKTAISNPVASAKVAIAGTVGAGLLASSQTARSLVVNAPSNLFGFGSDVGNFIDNPSLSTAKDVVTEHPIATAGTLIAGGLAVGGLVAAGVGAYSNFENTRAVKKNTEATLESAGATFETAQIVNPSYGFNNGLPSDNTLKPVDSTVNTLQTGTQTKPKTRKKRKKYGLKSETIATTKYIKDVYY